MFYFTPPTEEYKVGDSPLFGRIPNRRGRAVVLYADGAIRTLSEAPSIDGTEVLNVWSSARRYEIDTDTATLLTDAGYGAYVEEVA